MFHVSHPKISIRTAPRQERGAALARPQVQTRSTGVQSNAAPFTLVAVVVLTLLLAVTMAIVTAHGG